MTLQDIANPALIVAIVFVVFVAVKLFTKQHRADPPPSNEPPAQEPPTTGPDRPRPRKPGGKK